MLTNNNIKESKMRGNLKCMKMARNEMLGVRAVSVGRAENNKKELGLSWVGLLSPVGMVMAGRPSWTWVGIKRV